MVYIFFQNRDHCINYYYYFWSIRLNVIQQQLHSTNDSCFCLIYLKISLKIAIYNRFWYTFSFFFCPFYIITYWWLSDNTLLVSLSSFPSRIFITFSFLELVKIVELYLFEKVLTQLICLMVTCALLRLKTTGAIFFQSFFLFFIFGLTHHMYKAFHAFII